MRLAPGTAEQDGCAEQYAPTPSFSPRSEPEGRVSGMIRANPVKICVTRSVIIIYLCLLKESDTLRFTLSPQPVIARLVPGNPVKNSAALAAILNGGASRRHAKRDNYLPLIFSKKVTFCDSHCLPNPSLPGLFRAMTNEWRDLYDDIVG